jgi:ABC-type sugar transport system ATPase subunit
MPTDPHHDADFSPPPLFAAIGIVKSFPGVRALRSANLALHAGAIHALVGANGAGKSTLVKIMTGALDADSGELRMNGEKVSFPTPLAAWRKGIATIYQEFSLVPSLSIRANLFLGHEKTHRGQIDEVYERREGARILELLGVRLDLETLVRDLSVANQQLIEIARALAGKSRVLIMDEPTASLSPREADRLFAIIRDLAKHGMSIVFISHRLEEILALADWVTVMRDGETLETRPAKELNRGYLIERMTGRVLTDEFPPAGRSVSEPALEVRDLSGGRLSGLSFVAHRGEVLGLAGLVGSGRTELVRMIFGADRPDRGMVLIDGQPVAIKSPRDAIARGLCLLTEDRKAEGLILNGTILHNFALPNLGRWSRLGWIRSSREQSRFRQRMAELKLAVAGPEQLAGQLSGGNQQKLLVARWLETEAQIVIFDEPTRGIDAAARHDMYVLIDQLARQGKTIIVVSSDFQEILGLCDRVLVMREGRIAGEITDVTKATAERIMALAV